MGQALLPGPTRPPEAWPLTSPAPATSPLEVLPRGLERALAPTLVGLLVGVRALALPGLGLFSDEAYYWEWSRRLSSGFYDHPPVVAWLLAASGRLAGRTLLAVHLPAFLLSLLTTAALMALVAQLFPGRRDLAWASAAALNAAPLFSLGAVFTTPDAPLLLLWVVTLLLVWRAATGDPRLWYLAGLTAGLGLLSKYGMVLLPPSVLAFLMRRRHRHWLARREPWLALAIMVAIFTPALLWNAEHGWVSFRFQFVDRFAGAFRPWRTVPRFLTAQQAATPLLWAASLAGLWRSARLARAGSDAHALLALCGGVTLACYGLASLFTYVNANWLGPAYLTLLVSGADLLLGLRSALARVMPTLLAAAVSLLFYLQAFLPLVPLPPRLDPTADLVGWREVAGRLEALAAGMPRPGHVFAYSHRFQLSAAVAFHAPGLEVTRLGGRDDAYDAWRRPDGWRGEDAVYLCDGQHFEPPTEPFRSCQTAGHLPVVRGDRVVRTVWFWRCLDYQPDPGAAGPDRSPAPAGRAVPAARAQAGWGR